MSWRKLWSFGRAEAGDETELARALDELCDRILRGENVDWDELAKRYPGDAESLNRLKTAVRILVDFGPRRPGASDADQDTVR